MKLSKEEVLKRVIAELNFNGIDFIIGGEHNNKIKIETKNWWRKFYRSQFIYKKFLFERITYIEDLLRLTEKTDCNSSNEFIYFKPYPYSYINSLEINLFDYPRTYINSYDHKVQQNAKVIMLFIGRNIMTQEEQTELEQTNFFDILLNRIVIEEAMRRDKESFFSNFFKCDNIVYFLLKWEKTIKQETKEEILKNKDSIIENEEQINININDGFLLYKLRLDKEDWFELEYTIRKLKKK